MDDMPKKNRQMPAIQPPDARLGFMLYRCGLAVSRGYERALKPIQTAPAEAGVLSALAYRGPNHVRGLARMLGLGRQTIVNVTRRLEAAKLLQNSHSDEDGRLLVFCITQEGQRKLSQIENIATAFDLQLREIVGTAHGSEMTKQLQRIVDAPFLAYGD